MAKFTAPVPLNIRLPGGFEAIGVAGTTHRIPDSLVEEFVRDQVPSIPGGVTWITQDETSAIVGFDPSTKYDKTGGPISGSVTVSAINSTIYVSAASALQVAIDSISATGGQIILVAGDYTLSSALTIPGDGISIRGQGRLTTTLRWTGSGAAIINSNTASTRKHFYLGHMTIRNNNATTSAGGIRLENFYGGLIEFVEFVGMGATGIAVEFYGTGSTYHNTVRDCWLSLTNGGSTGFKWTSGAADPNANRVIGCSGTGTTSTTMYDMVGGQQNLILASHAEGATILINVGTAMIDTRIIACRFEGGTVNIDGTNTRMMANTHASDALPTVNGAKNVNVFDGSPRFGIFSSSVTQDITSSLITQVTFNVETADKWAMHSGSSGDVTIPSGGLSSGTWRITGSITWPANATGGRITYIYKNGSAVRQTEGMASGSGARVTQIVQWEGALVAGDVITLQGWQSSGATLTLSGVEAVRPWITLEKII